MRSRIASEEENVRGDPFAKLLETNRLIAIQLGSAEAKEWRFILTETYPRYVSAFGSEQLSRVRGTLELIQQDAEAVIPDVLRHAAINASVARREILARHSH